MGLLHLRNQRFLTAPFLPGTNHDGRAVRVIRADVDALVTAQLLKADPDIGLNVLHEMAEVDRTVCIRQGRCDQDPALSHLRSPAIGVGYRPC